MNNLRNKKGRQVNEDTMPAKEKNYPINYNAGCENAVTSSIVKPSALATPSP